MPAQLMMRHDSTPFTRLKTATSCTAWHAGGCAASSAEPDFGSTPAAMTAALASATGWGGGTSPPAALAGRRGTPADGHNNSHRIASNKTLLSNIAQSIRDMRSSRPSSRTAMPGHLLPSELQTRCGRTALPLAARQQVVCHAAGCSGGAACASLAFSWPASCCR